MPMAGSKALLDLSEKSTTEQKDKEDARIRSLEEKQDKRKMSRSKPTAKGRAKAGAKGKGNARGKQRAGITRTDSAAKPITKRKEPSLPSPNAKALMDDEGAELTKLELDDWLTHLKYTETYLAKIDPRSPQKIKAIRFSHL